jgi:hypothetical protein
MPKICAVIIDTYECKLLSTQAINRVLRLPKVSRIYTFSEFPIVEDSRVKHIKIKKLLNVTEYNNFVINDLHKHIERFEESHCLIFQWDGFPVSEKLWEDKFLDYDYIGAPLYNFNEDGLIVAKGIVGNSGFCLASKKLFKAIETMGIRHDMSNHENDDIIICVNNRLELEAAGIQFAPINIASKFSLEMGFGFNAKSFGFHGFFNFPIIFSEGEILNFSHELCRRVGNNHNALCGFLKFCILRSYRKVIPRIINSKTNYNLIKSVLHIDKTNNIRNYCADVGIDLSRFG